MAKPTHHHGETYSSPWRNLLITMAKPTFQLQNPLILLAKNAPEDRRKKKEEETFSGLQPEKPHADVRVITSPVSGSGTRQ
jgi:hypothetical protein